MSILVIPRGMEYRCTECDAITLPDTRCGIGVYHHSPSKSGYCGPMELVAKKKREPHPYVNLTDRQFQILKKMVDEEEEMAVFGRDVYVGVDKTSRRTFNVLILYCLISGDGRGNGSSMEGYFTPNESGRRLVAGKKRIYSVYRRGKLVHTMKPVHL